MAGQVPKTDSTGAVSLLSPIAIGPLAILVAVKLAVHWVAGSHYDFFRDELYYIQWSKHLAWGYVEQPPLTALAVFLTRLTLGGSLFALRFLPSVCGAIIVLLTGLMARQMGAGRFGQSLAALCVLIGPTFLGNHFMMTMNVFDQIFWVICAYLLVCLLRTDDRKLWLWFGLFAGLGLQAKLTMPFFGAAVLAALLLTQNRRYLLRKEIWLGAAIASALFAPFVVWLARNNWATLEFMVNYGSGSKTVQAGFLHWFYMQVMTVHPLTVPIWAAGLYFCFFFPDGRRWRMLGWLFVILYAVFFLLKAKFYFLSPAFPMLLAAGSVLAERRLNSVAGRWLRPAYVGLLVLGGAVTAPLAIPLLPIETLVRYAALWGGNAGVQAEQLDEAELPQHFADQFGWEEMVKRVAEIYNSLPPDDRTVCAIFAQNYGEAAAVDFYGSPYGLPPALSGHNTYHLWGPRGFTGRVLIAILPESDLDRLKEDFNEVTVAGRNDCRYCMPYERSRVFFLCRGLKVPMQSLWPMLKSYN